MRNVKGLFVTLLVIIALELTPFFGGALASKTWTVYPDPGANFTTIQAAITNAAPGDSIEVWNGTYYENVVVNKQLNIYSRDGADVTIVNTSGSGSAITIIVDGCIINGFNVTRGGTSPTDAGIKVESSGNIIENNICYENGYDGILLSSSSNNQILNNTCSKNNHHGIDLRTSSNNTIFNNTCSENSYYGFKSSSSSNNAISNNTYYGNRDGIYLVGSSNNKLSNNSCYENTEVGIHLVRSRSNILWNNDIMDNTREGFHFVNSSNNILVNNEIRTNSKGIYLIDSSSNRIYRNEFVNNRIINADSENSDNIWNSSFKMNYTYNSIQHTNYTGNYWSDCSATDSNGDGIGNAPYDI